MKKLTAGIFATLLTVVTVGAANADIASKAYVEGQIGTVNTALQGKADASAVTALEGKVTTAEGEIDTLQATVAQHTTDIAGKANAADVYKKTETYSQTEADEKFLQEADLTGYAKTAEVAGTYATKTEVTEGLEGKLDVDGTAAKATADAAGNTITTTYATKTEVTSGLATKQDKNMGAGAANKIVTTDGTGNITTSDNIAATQVSGLATVATSGSYNDLTNKPTIPEEFVLEAATSEALGGVKSGGDITVNPEGAVTVAHATKADSATKATQDGDGNVISSTYAKTESLGDLATKDTVSEAEIADNAVTTTKIKDANVTKAKLDSGVQASLAKAEAAIPAPSSTESVETGTLVLTYNTGTKQYAWESIARGE